MTMRTYSARLATVNAARPATPAAAAFSPSGGRLESGAAASAAWRSGR